MPKKLSIFVFAVVFALFPLFSGCSYFAVGREKSAGEIFNAAEKALSEHRFNEARYYYGEVVKKYPHSDCADDALYKKGYVEICLSEYVDAHKSFSALLRNYPSSRWRFDASLWDGVLGELIACKNTGKNDDGKDLSDGSKDVHHLQMQIERMSAENRELRKQLQKLRELLQE